MKKGTKLYSIATMRCPKCHEDRMFKERLSNIAGIFDMHKNCTNCGQAFELEPGFYWGSMYVAYGIFSAFMLGSFVILRFLVGLTMTYSFVSVAIVALFMTPFVFRLARSIWINMYVSYDPNANKKE